MFGILKFNLISLNWQIKILALGGISNQNLKKIKLTKSAGIGAITFFDKKKVRYKHCSGPLNY
jgi:hypothetical protein